LIYLFFVSYLYSIIIISFYHSVNYLSIAINIISSLLHPHYSTSTIYSFFIISLSIISNILTMIVISKISLSDPMSHFFYTQTIYSFYLFTPLLITSSLSITINYISFIILPSILSPTLIMHLMPSLFANIHLLIYSFILLTTNFTS